MKCRVSQTFGPFILSFQLWFLLKFPKTGATLWGKSSQRWEAAQRCLECLRHGQAGQSRKGRWAFLEPPLPEAGDLGKSSSQIQSLTSLSLRLQQCAFRSSSHPQLFSQVVVLIMQMEELRTDSFCPRPVWRIRAWTALGLLLS